MPQNPIHSEMQKIFASASKVLLERPAIISDAIQSRNTHILSSLTRNQRILNSSNGHERIPQNCLTISIRNKSDRAVPAYSTCGNQRGEGKASKLTSNDAEIEALSSLFNKRISLNTATLTTNKAFSTVADDQAQVYQIERTKVISINKLLRPYSFFTGLSGSSLYCRQFHTSAVCNAEPMKRKKRVDPMIQKRKDERRQRKVEKQIRRLAKNARQLKPIEELQVPTVILDKPRERNRRLPQLTTEESESRWMVAKQMETLRFEQTSREIRLMEQMKKCQEVALNELRNESEELYVSAIEIDLSYTPYKTIGPVDTPPIKNYDVKEGDYFDISKKWEEQ